MPVHPSAVIEPGAKIGAGAVVGPFCHVGPQAEIGEGCEFVSHVVVTGETRLGARCRVFPFAAIGAPSQDLKSQQDQGRVVVGADCLIREGVTINAGTRAGGSETRIGDGCALLANSHVAHDCRLGAHVVLTNGVLLGGHVQVGDRATIGGGAAVHQHVRIGAHVFVAGLAGVEGDVPPYALAGGDRAHLFGLNVIGLRRRGFTVERIARLRAAYRLVFPETPLSREQRFANLARFAGEDPDLELLIEFLRRPSSRELCAPRRGGFAFDETDA
jgi:UDP-N-acetylglucosamine acyltransferase